MKTNYTTTAYKNVTYQVLNITTYTLAVYWVNFDGFTDASKAEFEVLYNEYSSLKGP